jgi:GH15 family glucan-1,4-alpha-glucosidase
MSIYYSLKKEEKNAKKYYYWVLSRLKDNHYIPEQIFSNTHQVSVSPLLWSHTMFFLATKFLDLF